MKTKNKKRLPGFVALAVVCLSLFILAGIVHADDPPVLTSISITPHNPTMTVGESLTFTAQGYDQYGDPFPISDPHWEGDEVYGTITPDPNDPLKCDYTANSAGNGYIICYEGPPGQATVHGSTDIYIQGGGDLARIDVDPNSVALKLNQNQQFSAKGYDAQGNEVPITPIWSTDGGTITSDGLYTATQVGVFTVTASVEGSSVTGTASVHVTPGELV